MEQKTIIIKDIKEIQKFKTKEKRLRNQKYHNKQVEYDFRNYDFGKTTVVFECIVPLGHFDFDSPLTEQECDDFFEGKKVRSMKKTPHIVFFADDIILKKGGNIGGICADNVTLKGFCNCEVLRVEENLKVFDELETKSLEVKNVVANKICVRDYFKCKILKAKKCILKNVFFENLKASNSFFCGDILYF